MGRNNFGKQWHKDDIPAKSYLHVFNDYYKHVFGSVLEKCAAGYNYVTMSKK